MDDGDGIARFIWIMLVLLLVGSSLLSRRMPMARLLSWSAGWVVLFLGIYLIFQMIEPQIVNWQQGRRGGEVSSSSLSQPAASTTSGGIAQGATVSIPLSEDGHYWVDATINGQTVRFLVDSGASVTALSSTTADAIGLPPDMMDRTVVMQTANGDVVARRSVVAAMQIGTIAASDLPVVVSPSFGKVNVLGMNFLTKLRSWRVENGTMVLEPR